MLTDQVKNYIGVSSQPVGKVQVTVQQRIKKTFALNEEAIHNRITGLLNLNQRNLSKDEPIAVVLNTGFYKKIVIKATGEEQKNILKNSLTIPVF
jgi:hypothetical protein